MWATYSVVESSERRLVKTGTGGEQDVWHGSEHVYMVVDCFLVANHVGNRNLRTSRLL